MSHNDSILVYESRYIIYWGDKCCVFILYHIQNNLFGKTTLNTILINFVKIHSTTCYLNIFYESVYSIIWEYRNLAKPEFCLHRTQLSVPNFSFLFR